MKESIITKVPRPTWEQAQEWERAWWIHTQKQRARYGKNLLWRVLSALRLKPAYRGDDWNEWWAKQFDNYSFLPPTVENMIELGCGPYTNARLVAGKCRPRHLVLSDPLIATYVNFKMTFVADMYRRGGCMIDDHPIEECPFASDYFDVVIMINVLDHVQDAERCMDAALSITRPGGFLVIGQELSDEHDILAMKGLEGEEGHPIKVNHQWFEERMAGKFEPVIQKVLDRESGRDPAHHYGTYLFAGRKNHGVHRQEKGAA